MRKKYVLIKLGLTLMGYLSIGLVISTLIITIFGYGSNLISILLVCGLGLTLASFYIEQRYQRKIDELDNDKFTTNLLTKTKYYGKYISFLWATSKYRV